MNFKKLQYCLLGVWLITSVGILAWGVWPRAQESRDLIIPGFGLINLEWNPENWMGDITVVKLTLSTQNGESLSIVSQLMGITSYTNIPQSSAVNTVKPVDRFVEARLEIPAVDMKPRNTVGQSYQPGDEVIFYWNVKSLSEGDFQGRVWLYTGNQSLVEDSKLRYPIAVQTIELKWRDLFGLSGIAARYAGLIGLVAGIIMASLLLVRARRAKDLNLN